MKTRKKRRGCPEPAPVKGASWIELGAGRFALVDEQDYEAVMAAGPWHAFVAKNGRIYASRSYSQKLHRLIASRVLGSTLTRSQLVDHASGGTLDNRRRNLRIANAAQSTANSRVRLPMSGYRGVHQHGTLWRARIMVGGKFASLGYFKDPVDAARAWDAAARALHGAFERFNFPREGELSAGPTVLVHVDELHRRAA